MCSVCACLVRKDVAYCSRILSQNFISQWHYRASFLIDINIQNYILNLSLVYFSIMTSRLHRTCFTKKCTSKKSKRRSIILQLHPSHIMKIYFLSVEPAWHWVKGTRQEFRHITCAPSSLCNLHHVTWLHFFTVVSL